jgi:membrane protein DedA with SNARE-associated domain
MRPLLHKVGVALAAYGPWGILLLSVLDSMGIPLPATIDVLLIGIGAGSTHSPQKAYLSAFLAIVGSIAGNVVLFQAARHGRKLFSRAEPAPGKSRKFQEWFHRYGLLTVFVPAVIPLIPLPLKVFVISAGALHTPFVRFLAVIVVARVIRYFSLAYLGIQLGADAQGFLQRNGWTLAGIALAMALIFVFLVRFNERRRAEL